MKTTVEQTANNHRAERSIVCCVSQRVDARGEDEKNIRELFSRYITVLSQHEQKDEAEAMRQLLHEWRAAFVKAVPKRK